MASSSSRSLRAELDEGEVVSTVGRKKSRRERYSVADLRGIVPALPGRETIDFEDQITEAFEGSADRVVQEIDGTQ